MNITSSVLQAIFYSLDTRFQAGYQTAPKFYDVVASVIQSSSRSMRHAWLQKIPRLREWIGERKMNNLIAQGFEIVNKDYEGSIAVSRNDIDDDQLGVYSPAAQMLGMQAAKWPDDLLITLMSQGQGATSLGPDGVPFFSASHPVDLQAGASGPLGVYSNLSTALPLTAPNLNTVRTAMQAIKGEDGKAMGVRPNLLVVPPALEITARQILYGATIAPTVAFGANAQNVQASNPYATMSIVDLLVVPELSGAETLSGGTDDCWYLLDTTKPIRPFIFQLRKAPVFQTRFDPTMDNLWRFKEYEMGVDARGNAGYALPFLAYKAVGH